jgi:hypothetical protein
VKGVLPTLANLLCSIESDILLVVVLFSMHYFYRVAIRNVLRSQGEGGARDICVRLKQDVEAIKATETVKHFS